MSIDALSDASFTIASGTTTQQHIVIGGQTVIAVALTASEVPDDQDGGTPDASDGATGQDASDANDAQSANIDANIEAADKPDAGADQAIDGIGLDTGTD